MLIVPAAGGSPLSGDHVIRTVLRTDMTPVPATVEVVARRTTEALSMLEEGKSIRIGQDPSEYLVVKLTEGADDGLVQRDKPTSSFRAIAMLSSCVPIASRLQRAVIREGATLGEIYRACGAQVRIASDFTVPHFSCFAGMTPSFEVAKVLQEEAGALIYKGGSIEYRRLGELMAQDHVMQISEGLTEEIQSDFLERHAVPFAFSTDPSAAFIVGGKDKARGVLYRPRADHRIINNMGSALIQRRKLRTTLTPAISAGTRINVGSARMVVITSAHVVEPGGGDQFTQLWLGELVR